MWIYKLNWIDFISYDPRCPIDLQLMIQRVERDNEVISILENRCIAAHVSYKIG